MTSNTKALLAFGAGLVGGWALRSLADSPQGVGVKLLEIGMKTKERVAHWAALERERVEDMVAEARSKSESKVSPINGGGKGERRPRTVTGDA